MSALILVVDDEPDVAELFRQQFRKELRASRFAMEFAQSANEALERVGSPEAARLILILSDVNMPGMSGIELLPRARESPARRARDHDHRLWRRRDAAEGDRGRRGGALHQADRLPPVARRKNRHELVKSG